MPPTTGRAQREAAAPSPRSQKAGLFGPSEDTLPKQTRATGLRKTPRMPAQLKANSSFKGEDEGVVRLALDMRNGSSSHIFGKFASHAWNSGNKWTIAHNEKEKRIIKLP